MTNPADKVTCFITRPADEGTELLLFNHPHAGVQIPAGTVNPGEEIETAARREAAEESGLDNLILLGALGEQDDTPPAGHLVVSLPTPVYSRPDGNSLAWAHFNTGLLVEKLRQAAGFTQISYAETDRYIDPQYTTYCITGWVPDETLTHQRIRHFYLFEASGETHPQWSVSTDNHIFELFWALLNDLPPIAPPQDSWLKWLMDSDLAGL